MSRVGNLASLGELLQCRAGKLLLKGKPFIVIANDEPYFTTVYLIIRESEKAKGTWTEECERCFQELTHYDENNHIAGFPIATPELRAVMEEYIQKRKIREKIKQLQGFIKELLDESKI